MDVKWTDGLNLVQGTLHKNTSFPHSFFFFFYRNAEIWWRNKVRLKYPPGTLFIPTSALQSLPALSSHLMVSVHIKERWHLTYQNIKLNSLSLRLGRGRLTNLHFPRRSMSHSPLCFQRTPHCLEVRQQNHVHRCFSRKPQSSKPSISHLSQALHSFKGGKNKKESKESTWFHDRERLSESLPLKCLQENLIKAFTINTERSILEHF